MSIEYPSSYKTKMTTDDGSFWLILLLGSLLTLCSFMTACDIRDRKQYERMADKGFCWEPAETSTERTWRPCRGLVRKE